ncbi:hypothetical protein GCM10023081_18210 [Arthrobacter ginkgonis]|uniref:HTH luxR-type domain-containing protein n=1 Tax=Arthrobacter ginkgonis TaxID=1630594 RepID=A0ABP7C7X7_9MICC
MDGDQRIRFVVSPSSRDFSARGVPAREAPADASPLLVELLATTRIVDYAQRLGGSGHDRLSFLLELPTSRRMLHVRLSLTGPERARKTVVEAVAAPNPARLTHRELDVLTLLAAGHSNPQIAGHLHTSARTVSTQVEMIRTKLGAASRTAAGVMAAGHGWLKLPLPAPAAECRALPIAALDPEPAAGPDSGAAGPPSGLASGAAPARRGSSPVRLVLAYPHAGPAAEDGRQSRQGALLAIEEANARGGIAGRPIEAVEVDADIYSSAGVTRTFARIRALDPDAVMTSYVFDEATALDLAADLACPVLHTMTSQRQVQAADAAPQRYANVFQCVPTETNYGTGLLRFLDLLRRDAPGLVRSGRIAFIETPADAGQIADDATRARLAALGWEVSAVVPVPADPRQLQPLAESVVAGAPDVVVVSEFLPHTMAELHLSLLRAGTQSVLYCIYAPSIPLFDQLVGERAEGLVWSTVSGTYADEFAGRFVAGYTRRYGAEPGRSQAGLGYDMVSVLAAAWRIAADSRDFPGTLEALRATRHRGVNGSYIFSAGHQTSLSYPDQTPDPSFGQAQLIWQVQDGRHRCLDPAPYADARFVPPPWIEQHGITQP